MGKLGSIGFGKNRARIRELLSNFQGNGLTPEQIKSLQDTELRGRFNYTAITFFASILADGVRRGFPEFDPFMGAETPDVIHGFLQAVHNVTVNSADSTLLKDHFPFILLGFSALTGLGEYINSRGLKQKLEDTKDEVKKLIEEGEMNYQMKDGHSAVFAGEGDFLADLLQSTLPPDEAMYYSAEEPGDEAIPVWQNLDSEAGYEKFKEKLEKGNFRAAGEAIFFPVKQSEMFLPEGKDSFDMSLPELRSYIAMLDRYCDEEGIIKKKIIIVSSETLSQGYKDSNGTESTNTLKKYIESVNISGERISIVDPTKMVFEEIKNRGEGKTIIFHASEEDFDKYNPVFESQAREFGLDLKGNKGELHINYNTSDMFSLHHDDLDNSHDNIVIILDPKMYDSAVLQVGKDNVIYVPDLVNSKLQELANKTIIK